MGWKPAEFKGKSVWAEVDASGELVVNRGRVPIRYSKAEGAKIYGGGATRVQVKGSDPAVDLPAGVSADDAAPKSKGSRRGSGFGKAGTRTKAQAALAASAALDQIASVSGDTIICYTDGACKGNPGPAGSGALVEFPDGRAAQASLSLGKATNNIAELTAIALVLDLLDEANIPPNAPVALFSDSNYARGVLTLGWKAKKNTELILGLRERLSARPGVQLNWIAGHVGIPGNERADELANCGVAGLSDTLWREPTG